MSNIKSKKIVFLNLTILFALSFLMGVSKCSHPELDRAGIPPINYSLEENRRQSAQQFPEPEIHKIFRNGNVVWQEGDAAPEIFAGEEIEIEGVGLGAGVDVDYSKILVGKARVVESDMKMYVGNVDVIKAHYFEEDKTFDTWNKEWSEWSEQRIQFKVPETASKGPLVVSVQKRIASNASLTQNGELHSVWDPNTERLHGKFAHKSDVVSKLSEPKLSNAIPVIVRNGRFLNRVKEGEKIFWSYEFNIGGVHNARGLDWSKILNGNATDPFTKQKANPSKLFGAIPIRSSVQVPKIAREKLSFDPYPMPNPLTSLVGGKQLYSGETTPTGFVGYISATSLSPKTGKKGNWIGFSCASCHGQQITYPGQKGESISKVFAGLPNPNWSMKWTLLTDFKGVKGKEDGIKGDADKSLLLYHIPNGAGEHTMVRSSEDKFSPYHNDFLFSPIAIPNVTTHTPLRRSLSHTEFYAGFEGSYIHSEEPDGAIGSMFAEPLKALTSYMTTLDRDDDLLHKLAIYRWLGENKLLSEVNSVSEKEFIYSNTESYPTLVSRLDRGKEVYKENCLKCHSTNFGTGSDENMMPVNEVGTYFSPTVFHRETQSIRTSMMTHLYWVQKRGLLHDTHVKSLEDLVNPDRCDTRSDLYQKYYTMHKGSFRIPVGTPEQAVVAEKHHYFSRVDWDKDHFYWDYQKMLKEFGPREFGSKERIDIVKTPHPWCAKNKSEIQDLVSYLLTL